jgi:hypothetical protein
MTANIQRDKDVFLNLFQWLALDEPYFVKLRSSCFVIELQMRHTSNIMIASQVVLSSHVIIGVCVPVRCLNDLNSHQSNDNTYLLYLSKVIYMYMDYKLPSSKNIFFNLHRSIDECILTYDGNYFGNEFPYRL